MVEATPETVEEVLVSVLEDRERFAEVAAAGVAFARELHDGRLSARVLTKGLLDAGP